MMARNGHPAIGSLWRVNGSTYRVASVHDREDPGYPIRLELVELSDEARRAWREHARQNRLGRGDVDELVRQPMRVEPAWFGRADVREVRR